MQLICRRCGTEVAHDCKPSRSLSDSSSMPCPLKGALWAYCTNKSGEGIAGVKVKLNGVEKVTDKAGFVGYDPLENGAARVELTELQGAALEYSLPDVKAFDAAVTAGQVSLVEFQLGSWIEIVVKDGDGVPVYDVTAQIKLPDGKVVMEKLTKDKLNSAGAYHVKVDVPGDCEITFPELADGDWAAKA